MEKPRRCRVFSRDAYWQPCQRDRSSGVRASWRELPALAGGADFRPAQAFSSWWAAPTDWLPRRFFGLLELSLNLARSIVEPLD
jgi:hypothetical protein